MAKKRAVRTKARRIEAIAVETESVICGFCEGKGKDPFGIMSDLSTCCVCGGKGNLSARTPYVPCAFCGGTGVYPGTRLTCTACGGVGIIPVKEPYKTCPHCGGTGVDPDSEAGFYCLVCHGAGVVEDGE
jgi:DnaJ-class molecular chaperone